MARAVNTPIFSILENVAVYGDIKFMNQATLIGVTKVITPRGYTSWRSNCGISTRKDGLASVVARCSLTFTLTSQAKVDLFRNLGWPRYDQIGGQQNDNTFIWPQWCTIQHSREIS